MKIPKLVAHRGYMCDYPENTLSGLQAALEVGACLIEFDLQMNADQDFLVIHDDDFKRTAGVAQSVFSTTTPISKRISVHEPDRFGDQFYPEAAPFLTDCLALIKNYPKATALVEIKAESLQHWGYVTVMDRLIRQLNAYQSQCILISFDSIAIEYTQHHSKLRTGWVLPHYDPEHHQHAMQLQADLLICNYKKIPEAELPWPEFKRWMLYDISHPELAIDYGKRNVELIETPDIGRLLQNPMLSTMACSDAL